MQDKSVEERIQEGHYKLETLELHAFSDLNSGKNQVEKSRRDWEAFEKVQIEQEQKLAKAISQVHDAICKAHGIERNGRALIVSKDLATFTLSENADGQTEGQQQQEAKSKIVDASGRAIGDSRIVTRIKPNGKLDGLAAANIINSVEAERAIRGS